MTDIEMHGRVFMRDDLYRYQLPDSNITASVASRSDIHEFEASCCCSVLRTELVLLSPSVLLCWNNVAQCFDATEFFKGLKEFRNLRLVTDFVNRVLLQFYRCSGFLRVSRSTP